MYQTGRDGILLCGCRSVRGARNTSKKTDGYANVSLLLGDCQGQGKVWVLYFIKGDKMRLSEWIFIIFGTLLAGGLILLYIKIVQFLGG